MADVADCNLTKFNGYAEKGDESTNSYPAVALEKMHSLDIQLCAAERSVTGRQCFFGHNHNMVLNAGRKTDGDWTEHQKEQLEIIDPYCLLRVLPKRSDYPTEDRLSPTRSDSGDGVNGKLLHILQEISGSPFCETAHTRPRESVTETADDHASSSSESSDDELALLVLSAAAVNQQHRSLILNRRKIVRRRSLYMNPVNSLRYQDSEFNRRVPPMKTLDEAMFEKYLRCDVKRWNFLYNLVGIHLAKQNTHRVPISAEMRLTIVMRFLITGQSSPELAVSFCVGESTVRDIIKEGVATIIDKMMPVVMKQPTTEDLRKVAEGFEEHLNYPLCVGACDGKHCYIRAPQNTGSLYFWYKYQFSIVLLAVVSFDLKFIYVNAGCPGSQSDSTVLDNSWFGRNIDSLMPSDGELAGTRVPFHLIGDQGFCLRKNMMRPYSAADIKSSIGVDKQKKKEFNVRHTHARRVSENAFGVLASRFRILRSPIEYSPETARDIVIACCCLHDWLIEDNRDKYCDDLPDKIDAKGKVTHGKWREIVGSQEDPPGHANFDRNPTLTAKLIRDKLADYFYESDRVIWQQIKANEGYNAHL